MTQREAAICQIVTGVCFLMGDKLESAYRYAEELLGRPVLTHEFYTLGDKLKELAMPDFINMCKMIGEKQDGP